MKKLYTIISIMLLTMLAAVAQAPERFSYQAVVRNANNSLVANANVGVRVSILQGGATGNSVYTETHTAGTNANGLLTVEIGGGNAQQGSFQSIDWGSGSYFLKTEVDPNGGSNYSITSVQQLMSVPYALYAKTASNGFSGNIADYLTPATIPSFLVALQQAGVAMQSDIPEIPEIPTVPTNVSAFTNDAGYITAAQLPVIPENQVLSISNDTIFLTNGGFVKLPAATVGFSGDYNDLTNKPVIPTVPTNVSAFNNDAGYITSAAVPTFAVTQTDTGYVLTMTPPNGAPQHYVLRDGNDGAAGLPGLPGTPGFSPTITVSQGATGTVLTITDVNGTNQYVIPSSGGASGTLVQLPANWNETDPTSPQFILNKPELFSGNYEDLQNKPELFSGDYNDLTNKPVIPTVPTNVSAFTNDAGYITADDIPAAPSQVNADWNATEGAAEILNKPSIPTKLSQLTNDVGFISQLPDSIGGGISTETDPLFSAWDKDYNDLINKPEIPTVPENVSAFTNDAGYITESDLPAIPTVPTNVSAFNNDAGYITEEDLPEIPTVPTDISAFNNDAGYITADDIPAATEQVNADWNATSGTAQILNKPALFSGDYNDLANRPQIPQIPADVSAFNNDVGYITMDSIPAIPTVPTNVSAFNNDAGYLTGFTETDPTVPAWAKEANKPAYDYSEIANTPTIPTVPTNVSAFDNDAGYVTANDIPAYQVLSISNDTIYLSNGGYAVLPPGFDGDYNSLTNRPNLFSGSYNDLTDTPTIPTVPSNVSAFTNDAGYLTSFTEQQVLSISNDTIFLTGGSIVKLPAGFSGDYNDLTNLPQIPQIPADISAFTNDAGYITGYTETDPQFNAWDKDYNDLINKPAIPAVPTNVSAFTNDAGYITSADIPEIPTMPTNVSAFNNDAGYITSADIPEIPTVPTNVSAFTNDAHYITDVQLQQIMNTIASMQNTIDSMGLVMEVLYNQINQSDSIPAGIDTGLHVTFTTRISPDTTPRVHDAKLATSDQSSINDIDHYESMAVPSNTVGIVGYWVVYVNNYDYDEPTTIINTNKNVIVSDYKIWGPGSWYPGFQSQINSNFDTLRGNEFKFARHDGFGDIVMEKCFIAIKFVEEEPLQVTFTTTGYTNESAVHQSDLSGTNFIHNYATTNGLTGNVNDWWIFESDRRSPSQYSTYIYINKTITSFSILRWNGGVWQPVDSQLSKFTLDQSTNTISFRYYNESDESWEVETSLYAIKFND